VTFSSATPTICTIGASGTTATLVGAGTCKINADQSGDLTSHQSAPTASQSFTVTAAAPTVTVTSGANPSVFGQPLTFTATLTVPVTTTGAIQWSVNGTNVGVAVALSSTGTATFTPSPALAVGSDAVKASYTPAAGDTGHVAANGQITQVVNKANTTTTVSVSGNTLTATVTPVSPGAGVPTGTVAFSLNGVPLGSSPLASGVATFAATNVGNHAVAATYSGDAGFLTSSGNRSSIPPTIVATVSSRATKTLAGWYNAPVSVSFSCTANTAPIVSCPATKTLSRNGGGQSVTATVTATDGGTTTVTKSGINIDKNAPTLTVKRTGTTLSCHAIDGLSGLKSCRIHRTVRSHNGVRTVNWTAVARDHAGNVTRKHGKFSFLIG
jgi:hypothetical protein